MNYRDITLFLSILLVSGTPCIYSCSQFGDVPVYTYKIVNVYPHDRNAFTQGLVFEEGVLYEGTGIKGRSSVRKVALKTGNILKIHELPDYYFGEVSESGYQYIHIPLATVLDAVEYSANSEKQKEITETF